MAKKGLAWECECGNIEFGTYPPEECTQCQAIDSFIKVPEDELEDRLAENVLANRHGGDEEDDDE
ncbi:MAG: hypothetical protein KKD18_05270 [Nanoarchaeota archaeon]|nr:hypothetical protein [Nanoarchaeota archaeon]MBU0977800.1 hypothetical protein [Nanoarchaeota archaeon]